MLCTYTTNCHYKQPHLRNKVQKQHVSTAKIQSCLCEQANVAVIERKRLGVGLVIFSGGVTRTRHRTPLHDVEGGSTGDRYREEIVQSSLCTALPQIDLSYYVLQDDDARLHHYRSVKVYFSKPRSTECCFCEQSKSELDTAFMGRARTSGSTALPSTW